MTCAVCGRIDGSRTPRCIRCAITPMTRRLPAPLPGRYLVVDPGKHAGWCIVSAGDLDGESFPAESGTVDTWGGDIGRIVDRARASGCEAMIMEAPGLGRSLPASAVYGLGRAAGAWEYLWRASGRAIIAEIPGITWRSTEIGGPQRSTAEWKRDAIKRVAATWAGYEAAPDEADALCLAAHALHSLALADAIGKRRLKALGWVEPRGAWVGHEWRARKAIEEAGKEPTP